MSGGLGTVVFLVALFVATIGVTVLVVVMRNGVFGERKRRDKS